MGNRLSALVVAAKVAREIGVVAFLRATTGRKGRLVEVTVRGRKLWIRKKTPDIYAAVSCLTGEFEPLRHLLPPDYSGVIVDAGGYIGTAAIALNELFPQARVISIEASTHNFAVLEKNVDGIDNIRPLFGALVSRSVDTVELFDPGLEEWGYTTTSGHGDLKGKTSDYSVPAYTLDTLGASPNEIGILKLDIEGGELELFESGSSTLQSIPVVFVELHDRMVPGCSEAFFRYFSNRIVIKDGHEKYLSVSKN